MAIKSNPGVDPVKRAGLEAHGLTRVNLEKI